MDYGMREYISSYIEKHINVPVFFISSLIIFLLATLGFFFSDKFEELIILTNEFLILKFNWLLVFSVTIFLVVSIYLYFSKFGRIKLGGDYSKPEYSYFTWFAMLFSAGMGIGILFYGVGEPIIHYMEPPVDEGNNQVTAMKYTFLNWGFHAWATYVLVGLALAYVGFRRGLPFSFRFTFYPILKDRVYKWPGHIIDIFAVVATLFGVATSLGLGAIQINAGLTHLFGIDDSLASKLIIIMVVTLLATLSVISGVKRGIKWFSIINISLAALLLLFVFISGPSLHILSQFFLSTGVYFKDFIDMSLVKTFSIDSSWLSGWTLFYWAWWISWAPYVGMFIAKISKGRTIKEFVAGVLLVPTLLTMIWFSVFGNASISLLGNNIGVTNEITNDVSTSLFLLLQELPFAEIISVIAIILIVTFFVTSSDSGSFVIDLITSGGKSSSVKLQRAFWSILQGLTASVLLIGGGLIALQTAVITMAIPFSLILLVMVWSLLKGLNTEFYTPTALKEADLEDLKAEVTGHSNYYELHPQAAPQTKSNLKNKKN